MKRNSASAPQRNKRKSGAPIQPLADGQDSRSGVYSKNA